MYVLKLVILIRLPQFRRTYV